MDNVGMAFEDVKREDFLPEQQKAMADIDMPLPIGFCVTNSQPTTVQMMLRWLEIEPGNKILDVGSGSGWTTALLAYLTGPKGYVYGVEVVPELVEFGRENCRQTDISNVAFYRANPKKFGLPKFAPYDRILVSAAASTIPEELVDQLKVGGRMVVPVHHTIYEIEKTQKGYETWPHYGFVFVPLVKT